MKSEKEKITYTLYEGDIFLLRGSKDTINMYLRMTLDKWEDIVLAEKRKAVWMIKDGEESGKILKEFSRDKDTAFKQWYAELRLNRWEVRWVEDGRQKYHAADHFFLGVNEND